MARHVSSGIIRRARSIMGPRQDGSWAHVAHRVGLSVFAFGFVGFAIAVSVGGAKAVLACVVVTAVGGLAAGFGIYGMFHDVHSLAGDGHPGDDSGEDGDGDGGGWRRPAPAVPPPRDDGSPPEVPDDPAWWPAFERQYKSWLTQNADSSAS